jgi:hypothetical protein
MVSKNASKRFTNVGISVAVPEGTTLNEMYDYIFPYNKLIPRIFLSFVGQNCVPIR